MGKQLQLNRLTDKDPMPFGKHKGTPMRDVPVDYLIWLMDQPWIKSARNVKLFNYLEANKSVIEKEYDDASYDDHAADFDVPYL